MEWLAMEWRATDGGDMNVGDRDDAGINGRVIAIEF